MATGYPLHTHPAMSAREIPRPILAQVARNIHEKLSAAKLRHTFLGGYEMVVLGSRRPTKDIDVEVEKPKKDGYKNILDLFNADPYYGVLPGADEDGLRLIHLPLGTGIDLLMRWNTPLYGVSDTHHNFGIC